MHINIGQIKNNKVKEGKGLFPDLHVSNDLYRTQLGHTQHARSDLYLVPANMRVLLGLVAIRPRSVGDGAAESMLVVARLGAAADRQGAAIDRLGSANDREVATVNRTGAASDHQGATVDRPGAIIDNQCAAVD
jgi:hypothetical protein